MLEGASKKTYVTAKINDLRERQTLKALTKEDHQRNAVLIGGEVKVIGHARNSCIANTGGKGQ
jgi:hypothetical protein